MIYLQLITLQTDAMFPLLGKLPMKVWLPVPSISHSRLDGNLSHMPFSAVIDIKTMVGLMRVDLEVGICILEE